MKKIASCSVILLTVATTTANQIKPPQAPNPVPVQHVTVKASETSPIQDTQKTTITNGIAKKDLGYYKMFSWHYPEIFTIRVNGKEIQEGKSIDITDSTIDVSYEYEWKMPLGRRTGKKQVRFEIPQDTKQLNITFNGWKEKQRIAIEGAKKISDES